MHEGSYAELVVSGGLSVDEGQHVPSIERVCWPVCGAWEPLAIVCDNYRAPELHHVVSGRVPRHRASPAAAAKRPATSRRSALGFSILRPG